MGLITGCNRAGVASSTTPPSGIEPKASSEKQKTIKKRPNGSTVVIIVAVVVPVILALLTVAWYFSTRNSAEKENKILAELDANKQENSSLPIEAMQGSLSMSDVLMSPTAAASPQASPPPESFSIDEDEIPVDIDPENKIV